MINFVSPYGIVTTIDVLTTIGVSLSAIVAWRQNSKDIQISALNETISFLKNEIIYLRRKMEEQV